MPYDIVLYLGIVIWITNRYRFINTSWPFYLFIVSLILQLLYGWNRGLLELSQLIQKMLFYLGTALIFTSLQKKTLSIVLKNVGPILFYGLVIIVVFEEIGFSPFKSLGIVNIHGQSFRYFGLHNERLYLSELMLIGGVGLKINKGLNLNTILLVVLVISALNQSFTGILQVLLVRLFSGKLSFKTIMGIAVMGIALGLLFLNINQLYTGIQGVNILSKVEQYSVAPEESFRYLTNIALLENYFTNPTLFGFGMNANIEFISNLVGESLTATSHSVIYLLHDGGAFGMFCGVLFIIHLLNTTTKRSNVGLEDSLWLVTFAVLSITRMLVYFHPYLPIYYLLASVYANKPKKYSTRNKP